MDIKNYIESGILELYVAGALSQQERKEVEQYAQQYPDIKHEIAQIENAFESYAMMHSREPSSHILQNILSGMQIPEPSQQRESGKVVQLRSAQNTSSLLKYLAYAAVALLFISGTLNVYYYNSYQRVKNDFTALQGEKEYLANQFNTIKTNYDQVVNEMEVIKSPNTLAITLKGLPAHTESSAIIYWNKASRDVFISVTNLPAAPDGHQYQLWALKDGKPVDAGVFDVNSNIQTLKNITSADAFAVTLEPAGGSVSPTLETLYVMGNV